MEPDSLLDKLSDQELDSLLGSRSPFVAEKGQQKEKSQEKEQGKHLED